LPLAPAPCTSSTITVAGGQGRVLYLLQPDNAGGLGFEREETWSGAPNASTITRNESRHYIQVPGTSVVVKTVNGNWRGADLSGTVGSDAKDIVFWHKDALGSAVTASNTAGSMVEEIN
jgi:hypothetical protein